MVYCILGFYDYKSLFRANKSWKTFCKAKLWAGSARDSVDATIEALTRKLSMKGVRQQGVGDGSHHLLSATLHWQVPGLHHSSGEEEQDCAKHVLVLQRFRL